MNLMITDRAPAQAIANSVAVDVLSYATARCALGEVLVARSSKGVCAVLIGDSDDELEADLTRSTAWPAVERAIETAEHRETPERVAGDNGTVPKPTLRIVGPSAE